MFDCIKGLLGDKSSDGLDCYGVLTTKSRAKCLGDKYSEWLEYKTNESDGLENMTGLLISSYASTLLRI